jgi:hypothetical protein
MLRFIIVCAIVGTFLQDSMVVAQGGEAPPPIQPAVQSVAPPQPPRTLGEMLPNVYWNTTEQGVLLAVAPERTMPKLVYSPQQFFSLPTLPFPPPRGYNLNEILVPFEYRLFKTGTANAIAPIKTRVFTRPTLSPEDASLLGKEEAAAELFASFTQAQWGVVGDKAGIGMNDLTPKQQKLYARMLPERILLQPNLAANATTVTPQNTNFTPIEMGSTQIRQMRLRIARHYSVEYIVDGQTGITTNLDRDFDRDTNRQKYHMIEMSSDPNENLGYSVSNGFDSRIADTLYPKIPNKLKISDLDYKSKRLRFELSLKDIKTVDDIVKSIAKASQVNLRVDARVGKLPIFLKGDSAQAGDLLQALCLSLQGTFRKIDPNIFLLCEGKDGLGSRLAAYQAWQQEVGLVIGKRQEKRNEEMKKNGASVFLDDPHGLSPDVRKKAQVQRFGGETEKGIETALLPESLQKVILKHKDDKQQMNINGQNGEYRFRMDRVELSFRTQSYWILPEVGQFSARISAVQLIPNPEATTAPPQEEQKPPSFVLPPLWKKRGVMVSVQSIEETKQIIALAKDNGFTQAWLGVPTNSKIARLLLTEAIKIGKEAGVSIGVILSPFSTPKDTLPASIMPDLSILGETTDKMRNPIGLAAYPFPDTFAGTGQTAIAPTASNLSVLKKELREIASTPQLSGVLFRPVLPNSYRPVSSGFEWMNTTSEQLGYLLENRLAFLQKESVDPIDIVTSQYMNLPFIIPYFHQAESEFEGIVMTNAGIRQESAPKKYSKLWNNFLVSQAKNMHESLFTALTQPALPTPIYSFVEQTDNGPFMNIPLFVGLWKTPQMKVPVANGLKAEILQIQNAEKISSKLWIFVPLWGNSLPEWTYGLGYLMDWDTKRVSPSSFQGVILDLHGKSMDKVSEFLHLFKSKVQVK